MKKFLTYVSLVAILVACLVAAGRMAAMPRTYEGQNANVAVAVLQQSPESYDDSTASCSTSVDMIPWARPSS